MTLVAFVIGNSHHIPMNGPLIDEVEFMHLKTVPIKENL